MFYYHDEGRGSRGMYTFSEFMSWTLKMCSCYCTRIMKPQYISKVDFLKRCLEPQLKVLLANDD